jgi:serine/threonine protein kinase
VIGARARAYEAPPLARGTAIRPGYEVIEHLRRGNDLDVYDAWSEERLARCVIKTLRPDRLGKRRAAAALRREGALLARLAHPHIVRAYETFSRPHPAVVLETLPGATLSVLIADEPPPSAEEIGHLGLQLGSALHYLHRNGILHLDLKPSNLIADAGSVKVIDLSLARSPGPCSAGLGTWHYLSPEQARGGHVGPAADVWGLGAVLFEVATGEAPFDDDPDAWREPETDSEPERYPQLERPARRPESVRSLPAGLADTIAACLEPGASDRPRLDTLLAAFEDLAALPPDQRRWSA